MASLSIPAEPVDAPSMSPMAVRTDEDDQKEDRARRRQARSRNRERHRIIAACSGAIVTSLTMTPFDVVKTRLQTQGSPESLFIPSSHVPPPTQSASASASASASSSPIPSSLKGKGKAKAAPAPPQAFATGTPLQHARSLAATNLATCCQKTYFTNNLAEKTAILCRFDPREGATGSSSSGSSGSSGSGSRTIGVAGISGSSATSSTSALKHQSQSFAAIPRRAAPHIPFSSMGNSVGGGGGAAVLSAEACLYPTPNIAAQHLPQLTLPSSRHFAGFVDAITKIVRYEGAPALWRGLSPSLVMSVPSQVIYMVGYDTLRTLALENPPARFVVTGIRGAGAAAAAAAGEGGRQRQSPGQPSGAYIASTTFAAGSVSRTGVAVLLAPLELFRTRLQSTVGRDVSLSSVVASVRDLVRAEGVPSLWRGLSATLWRDVPFSGAYWAGYEAIRRVLSGGKGMGDVAAGEKAGKTFAVAFASGSGSGMIAAFLTHPFDVIKTRRQTEASSASASSRGTLRMLVELGRREGTAGLWRGMVPRVAKVAPACGIMIGAYEIGLRWAGEADD